MSAPAAAELGNVADFIRGITFKPEDVVPVGTQGVAACMRTKNVQEELDLSDVWGIPEVFVRREDQYLIPGDMLVSSANSWNLVGKCCWVPNLPWRSTFGGFISVLRPNPAKVDPRYLFHWFASERTQTSVRSLGQKTTNISNLNLDRCRKLKLPLPPLREQRRIAEILDKTGALRAKRRAALAQLDSLTRAIFLDMFGDPRQDATRWPKARIESLIYDMRGGASLAPEDFVDEGFPILHKGAIKARGKISIDAKKKTFATREYAQANFRSQVNREFMAVTLRDLVPSGPSIGLVADLRKGRFDEYLLAQGAYGFRLNLNKVLPEYVVQLSNMPNFRNVLRQNAVGSTQIHIRSPVYLGISIPLPPLELQRDFAHRVESIEHIELVQNASNAEFDALFASLQHRAFHGEL